MYTSGSNSSLSDGEWKMSLPPQGQKFLQQLEDQVEKLKKEERERGRERERERERESERERREIQIL